ncbi:hypothetical protein VTN77DRAFT_9612 [Rasamsonia byssochlamydoides]|uniref:uncharacterized protein n=1 Tax=Rasamsonia byssochlamydoides TaxID=89139 RepID=UPI0037439621
MPPKAKKKETKPVPPKQTTATQTRPNWPPLRPLVPPSDLSIEPLLEDQIFLIRNFFTANLCKAYVSFLSSSVTLVTTPAKPKSKDEAVRINDRFQVQDPVFAEALWSGTALKELVLERRGVDEEEEEEDPDNEEEKNRKIWGGTPLGLNPNIRIYRYSPGQFFAQHYDDSNTLQFSPPSGPESGSGSVPARTTWTLLIYLTTAEGGETVFYPDGGAKPISVAPEVGMALLHRHGERCLLHEGKEVRSGEKWVIRSDLVVAR